MELTQESLQELINTAITQAKTDIMAEVNQANQGVAASINRKIKSLETTVEPVKETEQTLTLKTLQDQVTSLQASLKAKDEQAFKAERNSKIYELIASSDVNAKGILSRQIETLYGDKLVKENGKWYVQDNEDVREFETAFSDYLSSDEGSFFIKPSTTKGSNSSQGEKVDSTTQPSKDQLLFDAFSNL